MSPSEIDDIVDDEPYLIVRAGIVVWGEALKSPKLQSFVAEVGGEVVQINHPRWFYPREDEWEVYQYGHSPPAFIISPKFSGVRRIAAELDLPTADGEVYRSRFYEGGAYVASHERPIARYQKW